MTKDYKPLSKKEFHKSLIKSVSITALIGTIIIGGGAFASLALAKPQKEEFVMPVTNIATDKSANKPKGKIDLRSGYAHNISTMAYQLNGDANSGNTAYDYNEQSLQYMEKPLKTSKPKIYVQGSKHIKELTEKAIKVWQPQIQASLTDNPDRAQVVIKMIKFNKSNPHDYADTTDKAHHTKRIITLNEKAIKKVHMDNFGKKILLEHELGHAWGLMHDSNNQSILGLIAGAFVNRKSATKFKQIPHVTKQNRQMLDWMYHPTFWDRLFNKQSATLKQ